MHICTIQNFSHVADRNSLIFGHFTADLDNYTKYTFTFSREHAILLIAIEA